MYSLSLNEAAKKMFIFKTIVQVPVAQNFSLYLRASCM